MSVCNLTDSIEKLEPNHDPVQIPGTELQRDSSLWFHSRWCRITASICKKITSLGEKMDRHECFAWLRDYFWFKEEFCTLDMQYDIDEEQNAILAFANLANIVVHNSGFWINKKFPQLGASPDGLIFDTSTRTLSAIVEIKCLKSLKEQSFVEWMKQGIPRNACVSISGGKLVLKRSHPYYYQVQLQLLITEAQCCYFVLHSRVNEPHNP